MCETPGLDIRNCQFNVEVVSFLERSFNASIDAQGNIQVDSGITTDHSFPTFFFIGLLLLTNFIYMAKIALEMNLGFGAMMINALEFLHIFIV